MLNSQILYNGFLNILNNFDDFSEDLIIVSNKWANVFQNFYINQILPIPGVSNPNLFPSLEIFKSNFIAACKIHNLHIQFENIVQILHLGICTGVTMTGLYTTTPPTIPLKLQKCFNSNFKTTLIANMLSLNIFLWVQQTFSIQNSSGTIVKWL